LEILAIRGLHLWFWVLWGMLQYVTIVTNLGISARNAISCKVIWRLVVLVVAVIEAVEAGMAAVIMVGALP
jgi:hypothetical protein